MVLTRAARQDIADRLRAAGCVFAEDEAALLAASAHSAEALERSIQCRMAGQPLEHILGFVIFCGFKIAVGSGVFVPRQRTEFLVQLAVKFADAADTARRLVGVDVTSRDHLGQGVNTQPHGPKVVDLCCGCGGVGAVIAQLCPVELYATDIAQAAVECALVNIGPPLGQVLRGDLFEALPLRLRGQVDVLVANAPYVPTEAIASMPAEARLFEPALALDGGGDGLDVHRRIIRRAPEWLANGGVLLIETSIGQAAVASDLMTRAGLHPEILSSDEFFATVVVGSWSAG